MLHQRLSSRGFATAAMVIVAFSFTATITKAEFVLPNAAGTGYGFKYTSFDELLGSPGTPGGLNATGGTNTPLTNQSSVSDEAMGVFNVTSMQGLNLSTQGTFPVPAPTDMFGMFGDLALAQHTDSAGNVKSDIAPGQNLQVQTGDWLFYTGLGRNPLTGGAAGTGGYIIVGENSAFSMGASSGFGNSPSNLALQSNAGGTTINSSGIVTSGSLDNYSNNDGNLFNAAAGTAANPIILAAVFEDLKPNANTTLLTSPILPSFTPVGTVFAEELVAPGTFAGYGLLQAVGGASQSSILPGQTFITSNSAYTSETYGGPADLTLSIHSGLAIPAVNGQWQGNDNDPVNYIGSGVPEPASCVLFGLGMAGFAAARMRRRNRSAIAKA